MSGQPEPSVAGRPRWIAGAVALGAGLVLVAVWMLASSRGGDEAAGPPIDRGASAVIDGTSIPTPQFVAAPALLAPDGASDASATATGAAVASPDEGSAAAPWTGPTSTFTGEVVDHQGRPLAGADVICWPDEATANALGIEWDCIGPELQALPRTTTDAAGRFELRAPHVAPAANPALIDELGRYPWLLVEASGFAVRGVQCLGLDEGDLDVGTIAVEPGGTLTGRVVDEQRRTVAGARLHARQNRFEPRFVAKEQDWEAHDNIDPAVSDISGEDGRFELGGFWPGTAELSWVSAEGFLTAPGNDRLEIKVGASVDLGDIVLSQGGALSGIVVDEAGAPVAGADVFVRKTPMFNPAQKADDGVLGAIEELRRGNTRPVQTGADGRFTATALENGNLEAFVDAVGFEPVRVPDVMPGPQELRVVLVRPATLLLTVVAGEPAAPVAAAQVEATRRSGLIFTGESKLAVRAGSAPGTFVIERVGTFRTDLVVSAPGFATNTFSAPGAKPPETIELTVTLEPEARLSGRVITMDGQPIVDATVTASAPKKSAHSLPTVATSGPDGRYELAGLLGGERVLFAKAQGFIDGQWPISVPAASPLDGIDLQLERGAGLYGTYFGADGQPLRGEQLLLSRIKDGKTAQKVSVQSSNTGEYVAANLKSGQWEVGYRERVPIALLPGERVRLDLHAPKQARITGQVLAGGRPKAGTFVMALDKTNEQRFGDLLPRATTKADADGRYELGLDAGEWILLAGGYQPPSGSTNRVPLTLAWGDERVVDLVFSGERLSLLVVDADTGQSLEGASWYLQPRADADPPTLTFSFGNDGDRIGFWPKTDAQGHTELPYVAPGAYTLTCDREGYVTRTIPDVVVVQGEPREVRIELEAESVLRGTVKLATGVPVQDYTQVCLVADDGAQGEPRKTFTENGAFSFARVPDGAYRLAVWPQHTATAGEPGAKLPLVEQRVVLGAGESRSVDLLLPP